MMQQKIEQALTTIGQEQNVEILLACETGSRAWGFPSPDSDYDVRFIYAHPSEWYLSLNEKKDSVDQMLDNKLIDLSGWDLRKSLRLLAKSNVSLLERMQSTIVYAGDPGFIQEFRGIAANCFSPIATMHHYLSMSKKYQERIKDAEEVKLKDYFYVLRTAIAGQWIREKNTVPPLLFVEMFELLPEELQEKLHVLIDLKTNQDESYRHKADPEINQFLYETIKQNDAVARTLPSSKPDWEELNHFFKRWVL